MLTATTALQIRCLVWLTVLGVVLPGCGEDAAAPTPEHSGAAAEVPQETTANPDGQRWHDLRTLAFRPQWIGGTLVVGRTRAPATLHNLLWSSEEDRPYAKYFLTPYLLIEEPDRKDGVLSVTPCAAAALPVRAASARTWMFTLRAGLTWDDGIAVSAADYAASFAAIRDPEVRADARRAQIDGVVAVRALDAARFEVEFADDHALAPLHFGLQFTVVPAHSIPADRVSLNTQKQTPGFGPYRVAEWTPAHLVFELRSAYRGSMAPTGPAYLERVEFVFEPEEARIAGLQEGRIHLDTVRHEIFATLAANEAFLKHCWLTWYYLPNQAMVLWNLRDPTDSKKPHPLLGDVLVRRALTLLFPREELARTVYGGRALPVSGPAWRRDGDYDETVLPSAFDPQGAKQQLLAAGYTLGADGWLVRAGQRVSLQLLLPQGVAWADAPALRFQEAARSIGVEVVLRKVPFGTLVSEVQAKRHEAALFLNSLRPPVEYDFLPDFHSRFVNTPAANLCGLADAETDALLERARNAPDRVGRRDARRALHRRLDQLQPCAFLYSPASCVAVNRKFANVKVHDLGIWYRDFVLRSAFERAPPP
ncbi:MAG: hypothetical protein EXS14_03800 [Planctomycetes bacterium]|nr:hypothetical protein [Planctomycetota bacterium]